MNNDIFENHEGESAKRHPSRNNHLFQEAFATNIEKLTILLKEHQDVIIKKREWWNPFSIFLSILGTLLTSEFNKDRFGINAKLFQFFFLLLGFILIVYTIYLFISARKNTKYKSNKELIEKLKDQSREINFPLSSGDREKKIIIINFARYGTAKKYFDITEKISSMISAKNFIIKADSNQWGDPALGEKKTLKIGYLVNGNKKQITVLENDLIDLQQDPDLLF